MCGYLQGENLNNTRFTQTLKLLYKRGGGDASGSSWRSWRSGCCALYSGAALDGVVPGQAEGPQSARTPQLHVAVDEPVARGISEMQRHTASERGHGSAVCAAAESVAAKAGVGVQNTDCDATAIIAVTMLPQIASLCTASATMWSEFMRGKRQ